MSTMASKYMVHIHAMNLARPCIKTIDFENNDGKYLKLVLHVHMTKWKLTG
jgi:hypothetical protein